MIVDSHRLNHNQLLVPLEKRLLWSKQRGEQREVDFFEQEKKR